MLSKALMLLVTGIMQQFGKMLMLSTFTMGIIIIFLVIQRIHQTEIYYMIYREQQMLIHILSL